MREIPYDEFRVLVGDNGSMRALHNSDARVGGISMRQALQMSAACDRWLASRGIRTTGAWGENRIQFGKKK
jgi:hypothetical protein